MKTFTDFKRRLIPGTKLLLERGELVGGKWEIKTMAREVVKCQTRSAAFIDPTAPGRETWLDFDLKKTMKVELTTDSITFTHERMFLRYTFNTAQAA